LLTDIELVAVSGRVVFWGLAKEWLDSNVSIAYRQEFERELARFADEVRRLVKTLQAAVPMSDDWYGACISFGMNFVEPFVDSLRSKSVVLRARLGREAKGEGGAESTPIVSDAKREPKPSEAKAFGQWKRAIELNAELDGAIDKQVYDWIRDNMLEDNEKLPAFATWQRQLRGARGFHGERKNERRSNRPHGRSIVQEDQI
jgi:hypothetical protein